MRSATLLFVLLSGMALVPMAGAQRPARASDVLPIHAQLLTTSDPHQFRISVAAREDVQLVGDLRLLHLEVRATGSRRALPCTSSSPIGRREELPLRSLHANELWGETFDVRMFCWGRALTALEAGGTLSGTLGSARGRGRPVAQTDGVAFRSTTLASIAVAPVPAPSAPEGDVHVTMAPADALSGSRVSFRVTVRSVRPVRAWVRPDRFRFRVRAPDGSVRTCSITHGEGAPIADLFARVSTRSGPVLSLDARAYCGAHAFDARGIYEVTPLLDLDVDGSTWRMDSPQGTFEGPSVPLRVRTGTSGDPS